MKYRVYPPIGIARVGNSPSAFYVGPERVGSPGIEIAGDGTETPVVDYKAAYKTKRQVARFRLYQFEDNGGNGAPVALPAGARIEWTVRLVNKKDAVVRPNDPPPPPTPGQSIQPKIEAGMEDRIIDSGPRSVAGTNAAAVVLNGTYRGHPVELGELQTDRQQRLLVLGGTGQSGSPPLPGMPNGAPIGMEVGGGAYYNNRGWMMMSGDGQ